MKEERTYLEEIGHAALKAGFLANEELFRQSLEVLSENVPSPLIVKVGANDGVTHDPCAEAILSHINWRGLLIEPVPWCFEKLKANYPGERFAFENMAIGEEEGQKPFYYVSPKVNEVFPGCPSWLGMIGSFDRDFIVRHVGRMHIVNAYGSLVHHIESCPAQVDTLASVVARRELYDITLLHIDCEGYDYTVLKSLGGMRPMNIFIEHKHLSLADRTAMTADLSKNRYRILDCGADYFAFQPGQWLGTCRDQYARLMKSSR